MSGSVGRTLGKGEESSNAMSGVSLARLIGVLLVLLSCGVMLGWWLQAASVVRVLPGFTPMVFNTALCFGLSGAALLRPFADPVRHTRVSTAFGSAITALAGLVLAQHLLDLDLGIDWPSLHLWLRDAGSHAGRMSAPTAAGFLLGGAALLLATRARRPWTVAVVRLATLGVGTIGLLGLVGYVVSAHLLFPGYWFTGIAVHTAGGLLAFGVGLQLHWKRSDWGRAPLFARDDDRITVVGATVLIATALGAGIASFALLQDRVQTLVRDDLLLALARRVDVFQDMIELREVNSRIAATRPAVMGNLRVLQASKDNGSNIANVRAVVDSFLAQGFSAIAYHGLDGKVVARGGSFVTAPAIAVTLGTPDKAELLWADGFVLRHRIAMLDRAGKAGELASEQPLHVLTRLTRRAPGRGKTWDMGVCVARDGGLLCFPQLLNDRVFSAPLVNLAGESLPMARALRGETGTIITRDYRAQNVVAAFGPVGTLGLGMVLKVDAAEVFQPVREQLQLAFGLLVLLVAGGTLLLRSQVRPLVVKLMQTGERARKQERRVTELLDSAPDAIIIVDRDGSMVLVNSQTERLFGYSRAELLGQKVEILLPRHLRESHPGHRSEFFSNPRARPMGAGLELYAQRKDGTEFPVEISLSPLETDEGTLVSSAIRDITERKRSEEKLSRSQEKYRTLFDSVDEGVCTIEVMFDGNDKPIDYRFLEVNTAFEKQTGILDAPGRTMREIAPLHEEFWFEIYGKIALTGEPERFEHRAEQLGRWYDVYALRVGLPEARQVAIFFKDISERKSIERELLEKNLELERAMQAKDRFLATMSHELRTPLNAVLGFTGTLLMKLPGPLNADQEKQLKTIQAGARHLLALINDLLDLAKIEAGKVELHLEPTLCRDVVDEVAASLRPAAEGKGLQLLVEPPPQALRVRTDRRALSQILLNLLNNAIKFTEQGSVRVRVGRRDVDGKPMVEFSVQDTGIGIRAEDQERLFAAFTQVDAANRRQEGTGLGLHLSQKLAELLHGRIVFQSEKGRGSTFTLQLAEQ